MVAGTAARALLVALLGGCASPPAAPWVRDIRFRGNQQVGGRELSQAIALEETSWVPLSPRKPYDPLTLEVDRRRLEGWYRAHGWFFARVTSVRVVPADPAPEQEQPVEVEFTVDEGPRTRVSAVSISGLVALPDRVRREVSEGLPVRVGQPFDHARYLEARELVGARLRALGYAWAAVTGRALVDRDRGEALIALSTVTGPQVRYGRVLVQGSRLASEIERRVALPPGRRYRPEDLDEARARLRTVGRFSTVRIEATPRLDDPSIADVEVMVQEGRRNDFKLGVGVGFESNRQEVRLPVVYTRYGFLGGLRRLTLRSRLGYVAVPAFWDRRRTGPALRLDVQLAQPDLFIPDLWLRARVGYDAGVDYAFKYHGPRGSLGLEYGVLRGRLLLAASYNLEALFFYDLASPGVFENPDTGRLFLGYTNPYRLGYLLASATWDRRDDPLEPTRGHYLASTVEVGAGPLGSQFSYGKLVGELRLYHSFAARLTVSARLLGGALYTTDPSSPITRRFYAGGADSHRGFGFQRLSPQIPSASLGIAIPVGGDRELLGQVEVRANLFQVAGSWVGLALFVDAGDVPDRGRALDLGQLHVAVGPGLRLRTPLGVVRFDLGIRLNRLAALQPDGRQNPDPGSRFAWHLNLGEAF